MKIRVLAFATVSDILGRAPRVVEVVEGSRLADLQKALEEIDVRMSGLWPRLAIAVDGRLVKGDVELVDGCEVALLPPVSGGEPVPPICHEPIDLGLLSREVQAPEKGALLLFQGNVRNHHAGRPVLGLCYSAYEVMASERIRRICSELEASDPTLRVVIQHRLGEVPAGEPSVVIAVASAHRQAAYEASRTALERLKKEVPIWKLERYADGEEVWREDEALIT